MYYALATLTLLYIVTRKYWASIIYRHIARVKPGKSCCDGYLQMKDIRCRVLVLLHKFFTSRLALASSYPILAAFIFRIL